MSSVKELLHNTIDLLSDEEACQILEFIQHIRQKREISPTLRHLASDPSFKVPFKGSGGFRAVKPIQGKGVPASKLLVEDRR